MDFLQTLVLTVSLAAGYTPDYNFKYQDSPVLTEERFFSEVGMELSAMEELFFVGFSTKTEMLHFNGEASFAPIHGDYRVNAGMRFGMVEVGFEHYCLHPVETWRFGKLISDQTFGAADTAYVKFEGKFNLFQ